MTAVPPDAEPYETLGDRLTARNPRRAAHPTQVQTAAVDAVRDLLTNTSLSLSAAADEVADSIGCGITTVLRWCKLAGVGRETTLVARDRQWEIRLEVIRKLNRALADIAREHAASEPDHG